MRLEILLLQKRIVKNTKSSHEYNSSHSDNIKLDNKLYNCKKVIIKLSENSISLQEKKEKFLPILSRKMHTGQNLMILVSFDARKIFRMEFIYDFAKMARRGSVSLRISFLEAVSTRAKAHFGQIVIFRKTVENFWFFDHNFFR